MYNDTVLDHLLEPRNVGEIPDADGIGQAGNFADGDRITIYIKVNDNKLEDVRFKTFGCAAAIASSSMVTVMAKGLTIKEASKISNEAVAIALGGLPEKKLLCSNFAATALNNAIMDYRNKSK
ncbi:MAG: iron-sulfur cluster assembly scaffold protein [Caulobacteraceae bacterium]